MDSRRLKKGKLKFVKEILHARRNEVERKLPVLILTKQKTESGPGPSSSQQETVALAVSLCCLKLLPYEVILAEIHVINPY